MTLDWSMMAAHVGLYASLFGIYKKNQKNHEDNIKRIAKDEYRANLMWHEFCERKGIDPNVNGNDI